MVNQVILIGWAGMDAKVRNVNGTAVAMFTLVTSESYKNKEGKWVDNIEWHSIEAWRGLAEVLKDRTIKGQMLFVRGKIKTDEWTDNNGEQKVTTKIVADMVRFLSPKESKQGEEYNEGIKNLVTNSNLKNAESDTDFPDDLPF